MDSSRRVWWWPAAAAAAMVLALAGCATMHVDSFVERGVDFTKFRTYAWAPVDRFSTGDPRLDNNPFFQDRLRSDVDARLGTRGFRKAESGTADIVVHYHASVTQQIDVNGLDQDFVTCERGGCSPFVYEAGTLVIDLVDPRTNTLLWRGWAKDAVENVIDNQQWLEQKIDQAVARILDRLPAQ